MILLRSSQPLSESLGNQQIPRTRGTVHYNHSIKATSQSTWAKIYPLPTLHKAYQLPRSHMFSPSTALLPAFHLFHCGTGGAYNTLGIWSRSHTIAPTDVVVVISTVERLVRSEPAVLDRALNRVCIATATTLFYRFCLRTHVETSRWLLLEIDRR